MDSSKKNQGGKIIKEETEDSLWEEGCFAESMGSEDMKKG